METKPKVLKWALIIGILVVLNLFFNYTISLFYKEPDYNIYLPQSQVIESPTTKEECLKVGGQWVVNQQYTPNAPTKPSGAFLNNVIIPQGYCNADFLRQQEFSDAQEAYQRTIFIILVVLGVISLVSGAFIANEIVTLGLSWGGVLSLIVASMRYWSSADNLIKVLILGFALAVLIWLAIKKFGK